MDFCRNVSVSGGLPSDYPPEQGLCLSPPFPQHEHEEAYTSLDDLFPCHNTCEGDVNLEWLSVFVEDCLTSTGNCIPAPKANISNTTKPQPPKPLEKPHHNPLSLQDFSVPGKARSKRRRSSKSSITTTSTNPLLSSWHMTTSDPPLLLHQAYWLADSELIVPSKNDENNSTEEEEGMDEKIVGKDMSSGSLGSITEGSVGQPRRCTHCLSQRTPQWRAGPLGPKTLCNACGVRFKSGRLLPEYRPAKSPTFVSFKHSNSHKKVLEMRMSSN